jgi:hypothetical protein
MIARGPTGEAQQGAPPVAVPKTKTINDGSPRAEQSFGVRSDASRIRDITEQLFSPAALPPPRLRRGHAPRGSIERTVIMSQQHKFTVVNNDRLDLHDMSYRAVKDRIANRARVFRSNTQDSAARSLDLTDMSQRIAQTMHLGKTVDDIPH